MLNAIAGWINKYRNMRGAHDELAHYSLEHVMEIAKDLGVSVDDAQSRRRVLRYDAASRHLGDCSGSLNCSRRGNALRRVQCASSSV